MQKDYRAWSAIKAQLHNSDSQRLFFHPREIWYCHVGENIGFEQDGLGENFLRPMIVFRTFNKEIFWGIPLTRTRKNSEHYFQFHISTDVGRSEEKSAAILSQIRLVDARRLRRLIGYISESDFALLNKKFKALLP